MNVVIVDDHKLFREGLTDLLELRGIHVVGTACDGLAGVHVVRELSPDIVLLDKRMPETDGLEVLTELRRLDAEIPIVILTTSAEEADCLSALRLGAGGYLLKTIPPDELVRALRDVAEGKTVVSPDFEWALGDTPGEGMPFFDGLQEELTPRELEILGYIAAALSNKSIARTLGISTGTVKLHVKAILRKLGVSSRVQAAVFAAQHGFRVATPERGDRIRESN